MVVVTNTESLPMCQELCEGQGCPYMHSLWQHWEAGTTVTLILQNRKQRLREAHTIAQCRQFLHGAI